MLTIGRLASKFGLSRSTLLYYDSIGLLSPSSHSPGEYRLYSKDDEGRLEKICIYRKAGVELREIKKILDCPETHFQRALQRRFKDLGEEISLLHEQQHLIASLLKRSDLLPKDGRMTKDLWVSLLRSSGFTEKDMYGWHISFERMDPEKHEAFLVHLNIPEGERSEIRSWAEE